MNAEKLNTLLARGANLGVLVGLIALIVSALHREK